MGVQNKGKFGFVKPDSGESDIFVMPIQCTGFGNQLPPIGTRVVFTVGLDLQKSRPTAENVQPEESLILSETAGSQVLSGTMLKASGNFGFIQQDNGEADMF